MASLVQTWRKHTEMWTQQAAARFWKSIKNWTFGGVGDGKEEEERGVFLVLSYVRVAGRLRWARQ